MRRRPAAPGADLDVAELEHRALYGGVLPEIPELTEAERERWEAIRRGRSDWVPQRALHYGWSYIDPVHGRGGRAYMGRLRRAGDPEFGEGWTWAGFSEALKGDRDEIEHVITMHPEQAPRLRAWLEQLEAFGRQREGDPEPPHGVGPYYDGLWRLGYAS